MILNYLYKIGWFIGLLFLQVLILNNIHLVGYATPFLYIYLILKAASDTPRCELIVWGFVLGLAVDIFSDTPGMNASSTLLLAFLQPTLLRLFVPREAADSITPGITTMGIAPFLKYTLVSILIHHSMLLLVDSFSVIHWGALIIRILTSSLLTLACVMAVEGISKKG